MNMKLFCLTFSLLLSATIIGLTISPGLAADKESAYERIIRTGEIRCGYILWPPYFDKDITTGKFSGISYEYAEALSKNLGLTIQWAEELNPGDQGASLQANKIDAICAADGLFKPKTVRVLTYSKPEFLVPIYVYARQDDPRFNDNPIDSSSFSFLNDPKIRIAVIDGDVVHDLANIHFPDATLHSLQLLGSPGQMMQDVISKKADVLITDDLTIHQFHKTNPGKIKKISQSLAYVPLNISFLRDQDSPLLKEMIDTSIDYLWLYGQGQAILKQYDPDQLFFVPPAKLHGEYK